MSAEIRDVADGLWIWQVGHPDWRPGLDWERAVTSTCVESEGEVVVLDALVPRSGGEAVLERLDARPPTVAVVLKPDHVRDVDFIVERFGVPAYGPWLFWRDNIPAAELNGVEPGDVLPGGLVALYDGRGRGETPLWLPAQRALVFADALTAPAGELLVWGTPWHEERVLPALRALLDLPFEHVIVSHGEPVHDRGAFEAALGRAPWTGAPGLRESSPRADSSPVIDETPHSHREPRTRPLPVQVGDGEVVLLGDEVNELVGSVDNLVAATYNSLRRAGGGQSHEVSQQVIEELEAFGDDLTTSALTFADPPFAIGPERARIVKQLLADIEGYQRRELTQGLVDLRNLLAGRA